jgi:DNA gyrase subunit B
MATWSEYSGPDLVVLEGIEPVRKRPAMYVGSTDARALEHALFELIANAFDEHLAGRATRIQVELHEPAWAIVEDDGGGLSPSAVVFERIFEKLHVGATLDGHSPHVHVAPRLVGVGASVINALSARFEVETRRDGRAYRAAWEQGRLVEPLRDVGATSLRGTRVRFLPDPIIFGDHRFPTEQLTARLEELAWLAPKLELEFQGRALGQPSGIGGWVTQLAGEALVPESLVVARGELDDVSVECAFAQRRGLTESSLVSFVNYWKCEGGSHADGLRAALGQVPGLIAVVHVGMQHPRFQGPVQAVLEVEAAHRAVEHVVRTAVASQPWWSTRGA